LGILRIKDSVATYIALAKAPDLHQLSGRGGHHALTQYINSQIEAGLNLNQGCSLIDIGCGDGTLLMSLHRRVRNSLGIVPSADELSRLNAAYKLPNVRFASGVADAVPADDSSFDRIVINGVLLLLEEATVLRCLRELKRIARPDALVWIGEVPDRDELLVKNRYRGQSIFGFLLHKWRHKGFKKAARKAFALLSARNRTEVIFGQRIFWITAQRFQIACREAGLEPVWVRRHLEVDAAGQTRESSTRMDYLLRA
jgi:SAM-dependent methyltransferase